MAKARELKNITVLCSYCEDKAAKSKTDKGLDINKAIETVKDKALDVQNK